MSEGATRFDELRDRREREALERDTEGSPLRGRPIRQRVRNFHLAADTYVASMGGPLPWMRRLRQIEEETAQHALRLASMWRELALLYDDVEFPRRWRAVVSA